MMKICCNEFSTVISGLFNVSNLPFPTNLPIIAVKFRGSMNFFLICVYMHLLVIAANRSFAICFPFDYDRYWNGRYVLMQIIVEYFFLLYSSPS